jgi:hypothetical protein
MRFRTVSEIEHAMKQPGFDPAEKDNQAIRLAARDGYLEVVKFLASLPEVDPSACNNCAIVGSARRGHVDVVKFLVRLPNVNPPVDAVRQAASKGHRDTVEFLVNFMRLNDPDEFDPFPTIYYDPGLAAAVIHERNERIRSSAVWLIRGTTLPEDVMRVIISYL